MAHEQQLAELRFTINQLQKDLAESRCARISEVKALSEELEQGRQAQRATVGSRQTII